MFLIILKCGCYSVLYFPACTDVNGTVQPNCADVPLRICSLACDLLPGIYRLKLEKLQKSHSVAVFMFSWLPESLAEINREVVDK